MRVISLGCFKIFGTYPIVSLGQSVKTQGKRLPQINRLQI